MNTINKVLELKKRVIAHPVDNELILVPFSKEVACMNELFTLNESARYIWEQLKPNTKESDIAKMVSENYSIPLEDAEKDVKNFLDSFIQSFN
jgi:hypothetical protein